MAQILADWCFIIFGTLQRGISSRLRFGYRISDFIYGSWDGQPGYIGDSSAAGFINLKDHTINTPSRDDEGNLISNSKNYDGVLKGLSDHGLTAKNKSGVLRISLDCVGKPYGSHAERRCASSVPGIVVRAVHRHGRAGHGTA